MQVMRHIGGQMAFEAEIVRSFLNFTAANQVRAVLYTNVCV